MALIQGLDELKQNEIVDDTGLKASALDRVYHPGVDPAIWIRGGMCTITLDATGSLPAMKGM